MVCQGANFHSVNIPHILSHISVPIAPAENVSVDNTTSESITVSWEPPPDEQQNGIVINYVVRVVVQIGRASCRERV